MRESKKRLGEWSSGDWDAALTEAEEKLEDLGLRYELCREDLLKQNKRVEELEKTVELQREAYFELLNKKNK